MNFSKTTIPEVFKSIFNSTVIVSLFVFLITLATFSEVLTADFVQWDDNIIIYLNPNIGELSVDRILWAFTDVDSMMRYNPLTLLSWCATYQLFGFNPYGYHLGNLVLHAFSAGILFLILRAMVSIIHEKSTGERPRQMWRVHFIAVIGTLLWALHPMRVEPVAWATDRTYCLAVFFLLMSTLSYLKAKMTPSDVNRYNLYIGVSLILYLFSLLSYAIGISFFLVLLLFDYFLFYPTNALHTDSTRVDYCKKILKEKILFAIPAITIGLITVIVRIQSAGMWTPPVPLSEFNLFSRFMQAVYILIYYLYRPFYPVDLSPVYTTLVSFNPASLSSVAHALVLLIILILVITYRKRFKICLPLFLAHIIFLIPVLGIFEHPHYPVDRYALLSSMCISVFIVIVLMKTYKKKIFGMLSMVLVMGIALLGWMSVNQVKVWHNSESLFKHMIETLDGDPYTEDIYWRLGVYLYQKKRTKEAVNYLTKTLKMNPAHLISNKLLGVIAFKKNDFKKAKYHFKIVLKINKNDPQAQYYLKQMNRGVSRRK